MYQQKNGSILFAVPQPNILGGCNNYILDISCGDIFQGMQNIVRYQKLNAVHIIVLVLLDWSEYHLPLHGKLIRVERNFKARNNIVCTNKK